MCQALTKLREEGINLGRTEGINLGRTEGIIDLSLDMGMKRDQIKEKLMKMLNMTELEAEESITKYLEK